MANKRIAHRLGLSPNYQPWESSYSFIVAPPRSLRAVDKAKAMPSNLAGAAVESLTSARAALKARQKRAGRDVGVAAMQKVVPAQDYIKRQNFGEKLKTRTSKAGNTLTSILNKTREIVSTRKRRIARGLGALTLASIAIPTFVAQARSESSSRETPPAAAVELTDVQTNSTARSETFRDSHRRAQLPPPAAKDLVLASQISGNTPMAPPKAEKQVFVSPTSGAPLAQPRRSVGFLDFEIKSEGMSHTPPRDLARSVANHLNPIEFREGGIRYPYISRGQAALNSPIMRGEYNEIRNLAATAHAEAERQHIAAQAEAERQRIESERAQKIGAMPGEQLIGIFDLTQTAIPDQPYTVFHGVRVGSPQVLEGVTPTAPDFDAGLLTALDHGFGIYLLGRVPGLDDNDETKKSIVIAGHNRTDIVDPLNLTDPNAYPYNDRTKLRNPDTGESGDILRFVRMYGVEEGAGVRVEEYEAVSTEIVDTRNYEATYTALFETSDLNFYNCWHPGDETEANPDEEFLRVVTHFERVLPPPQYHTSLSGTKEYH